MIVYINSTCSSTDAYKLNYIPSKETPLEFIPEVPISEYALEFHDGELLEIKQNQDNISLTMSSAEIRPDFLIKDASLFNNGRIKGTLH
ncbi:hypothetical protein, partial [Criblamydia sequanensis]|uniref:hypothetical protein n=1 Tax=Candidatus Criblamydia sequanensis TaxID=340071 RepID=UPI000595C702